MVKARSIDVSLPPKKAYEQVAGELKQQKIHIKKSFTLAPFDRDHGVFVVTRKA
jgi:fibrillarin-like rRNA methylase